MDNELLKNSNKMESWFCRAFKIKAPPFGEIPWLRFSWWPSAFRIEIILLYETRKLPVSCDYLKRLWEH